ncbi:fatty acid-binding protein, adipocyte-like [Mercenaria mercenaria]|uniref:fatty acid-binding protein, adipocyte-like n=1 Tax=Mercenaria mercenaria TaxID=6596 RepID=UPI00234F740B|nr:fatty acid-binding protein, adipocyte-like [Mercenaria mercenaria]
MSAKVLQEIKDKFEGEWKIDRSECFEDFLREVGVNFFIRKMASMAKPVSTVKVDIEEEKIAVAMNAGFMVKADTYKLGEEFKSEHPDKKSKAVVIYEDGKLVQNNTPEDTNIKPTKATREIVGDATDNVCR